MLQASEQKSVGQSRVAFKENPKEVSEGVIILMDEQREFGRSTEIIFDQHKFERYVPGAGFTLEFWICFTSLPRNEKQRKGKVSYVVLFVRNRFTAELTVGVKDNYLFIELNSSKKEKAYSEKELKNNVWYQVVLVSRPEAELNELTLYVNGKPDSTITYSDFEPFLGTDVQFGQFKAISSFDGAVCDSSLSFFPLSQSEVAVLFAQGKKELKEDQVLSTSKELLSRSQQNFLRASYSKKTRVPQELIAELAVDANTLEAEEQAVIEAEIKEDEQNAQEKLRRFFLSNPDVEARFETVAVNFEWLLTVVSAMAVGRIDKTAKIEIKRFMRALNVLHSDVTAADVNTVGHLLGSFDEADPTMLYFYDLLAPIKMVLAPPVIEMSDKLEEAKVPKPEEQFSSPEKVPAKEEEAKEPLTDAPKEGEGESPVPEQDMPLPELSEAWSNGEFTVVINRCHDCHLHETYSRHSEEKFINAFNEIGMELKKVFPSVNIVGNYDKVTYMEGFDVYIRGVGPAMELDDTGRLVLFSKAVERRLPTAQEIVDKVILLAFTYGDSVKMAEVQEKFLKDNFKIIPKPYHLMTNKCPIAIPQSAIKKSPVKRAEGDDTKKVCAHWGCGTTFTEKENKKGDCCYHPGKFEFGSVKGWWPEGWSCCRRPWEAPGCTKGKHAGVPVEEQVFLCINHGEVAPDRDYPDSFCGGAFRAKNAGNCMYHSGYLKKNQVWSCCGVKASEAVPCCKGEHKYTIYPAEEAKIYFFNPPLINPGLDRAGQDMARLFKKYGRFSGYFKKAKEYVCKTKAVKKPLTQEEQEALDKEEHYCLHWGCEKTYCNLDNVDKKLCRFHPGHWDFGHTGITITQALEDKTTILWGPHWTCCRQSWKAKGCTQGIHWGPTLKIYGENPKKYKWPDPRAQVYFRKKISDHWKKFLSKHLSDDPKAAEITFHYFASTKGNAGKIPLTMLPMLLDKLNMQLLVLSEDLSFHFKYIQAMKGKVGALIDDGDGNIDKTKFLNWWRMGLEDVLKLIEADDADSPDDDEEGPKQ